jgi:hypothetical protein
VPSCHGRERERLGVDAVPEPALERAPDPDWICVSSLGALGHGVRPLVGTQASASMRTARAMGA